MTKFLEAFAVPLPGIFEIPVPVWIVLLIVAMVTCGWVVGGFRSISDMLYDEYNDKEIVLMERVYDFDASRRAGMSALRQELCSDKHSYLITTQPIETENGTSAVEVRLIVGWHTDDGNIPGIPNNISYHPTDGLVINPLDNFRENERIGYAEDVLRRTVVNKMIADFYDRRHSDIMSMSHESLAKHIKGTMSKTMNGITIDNIEVLYVREPGAAQ